ncbi:MAG: nuclear transport factor 2 family protein [Acidobacteria bacterium]|nr:nuclear transport factor 2 family protein [Acidobacteriota bacterium]
MSQLLRDLLDREAVVDAVTLLFLATDRKDWNAVRDRFTDTVHFDMTSVAGGDAMALPAEAIVSGWAVGLEPLVAVHHQAGNFRVRIDGDGADVFCYGVAWHYRPVASGRDTRAFIGSYDLHLVRAGADWKIDRFRFDCKFVEGNPDLEKEAARPIG